MKKISLYFNGGGSDKEYHVQIEQDKHGYVVNFQYGRRGSTLTTGTKTASPVELKEAEKIYDRVVKEKTGKGYTAGDTKDSFTSGESFSKPKEVVMQPQLLNEIDEAELLGLLNDSIHLAQEKKDGQRRMVISNGSVRGLNKKGQEVELPDDIIKSMKSAKVIVDGEIIGDKLFVFDLLEKDGVDLRGLDCRERVARLNSIKFGKAIEIVPSAYNPSEKNRLFEKLKSENHEGIVFKHKASPYTPGRPASGGNALKHKFVKTATFIVENQTKGKRSVGLSLFDDNGEKIFMGKVTVPSNHDLPFIGELVEVRYLYAYKGGCIFQPVYLGRRNDSDLTDATTKQIIYKKEFA